MQKLVSYAALAAIIVGSFVMTGCGKDEAAGGTVGAASGAVLGVGLAGRHSKGEGAAIGGLVGNMIGRAIGRSSNRKRENNDRNERRQEVTRLRAQNQRLQRELTKWCTDCNRQVRLQSAQSCPDCGGNLIKEKICTRCNTKFSPESGYTYCPYCSRRTKLAGR